jgi:ribosomal protein S17E
VQLGNKTIKMSFLKKLFGLSDNNNDKTVVKRIDQPHTHTLDMLLLPNITDKIFSFAADHPKQMHILAQVCYKWSDFVAGESQQTWQILARIRWPYINKDIKMRSWHAFYLKRLQQLTNNKKLVQELSNIEKATIENCVNGYIELKADDDRISHINNDKKKPKLFKFIKDKPLEEQLVWNFKCPVSLSRLEALPIFGKDHCKICQETVHLCTDIEQLQDHVSKGDCVVFDGNGIIKNERTKLWMPDEMWVGKLEAI